jgi:hypothetical protein
MSISAKASKRKQQEQSVFAARPNGKQKGEGFGGPHRINACILWYCWVSLARRLEIAAHV